MGPALSATNPTLHLHMSNPAMLKQWELIGQGIFRPAKHFLPEAEKREELDLEPQVEVRRSYFKKDEISWSKHLI